MRDQEAAQLEYDLTTLRAEVDRLTHENEEHNKTFLRHMQTLAKQQRKILDLRNKLETSIKFMTIATDWNITEIEIDGKWQNTYNLIEELRQVLEEKKL